MQLFESMVDVVSQGSVRRGRFSPYLPIEHKDISEFLDIGTEATLFKNLLMELQLLTNGWKK